MAVNLENIQPGAILNEVMKGCLKASGTTFEQWCRDNDVNNTVAKQALFGLSGGDRGTAILTKMIEHVGADIVLMMYRKRVEENAADLNKAALVKPQDGAAA